MSKSLLNEMYDIVKPLQNTGLVKVISFGQRCLTGREEPTLEALIHFYQDINMRDAVGLVENIVGVNLSEPKVNPLYIDNPEVDYLLYTSNGFAKGHGIKLCFEVSKGSDPGMVTECKS